MNTRNDSGFSLIELLAVVALVGIVLAMGIPAFNQFTLNSRITYAYNGILGSLNYARNTAVTINSNIEICPKTSAFTCNNVKQWEFGWVSAQSATDYTRVSEDYSEHVTVRAYDSNGDPVTTLTFDNQGYPNTSPVTFVVCVPALGANLAKAITVNNVGRTQMAYDQDGDNIPEDMNGDSVVCSY